MRHQQKKHNDRYVAKKKDHESRVANFLSEVLKLTEMTTLGDALPPPGAFSPGNSYVFCTNATFVARLIVDHKPGKDRTYNPSVAYNEA